MSPMARPRSLCLQVALAFALSTAASAQQPDCDGVQAVAGTRVKFETAASGIPDPVDLTTPQGDLERIFVVEKAGRIRLVDVASGEVQPEPFLDISDQVACCDENGIEHGLLGLAFHPRYFENGYFYVNYTRESDCSPRGGETVVSRFDVSTSDPNRADPGSEHIVFTFCQTRFFHNGGQLKFGPRDDYLYISTGDGGDNPEASQNGQSYLGKILRIDVDSADPYAVPPDNPFVGDDGVLDEIWALGLRNPWRFSFDSETGDLYIGDVGGVDFEEVNFQPGDSPGGENYEWDIYEGSKLGNPATEFGPGERRRPILAYPRSDNGGLEGVSVIGGVVYRGCRMPDLHGLYFFSDWRYGWVYSFRVVDGQVTELEDRSDELSGWDSLSAWGTDGRGEMYMVAIGNNAILRIVPDDTSTPVETFVRGDSNRDGIVDIGDPVHGLLSMFTGTPTLDCEDAADANDDGEIDVTDPVLLLQYLFTRGGKPPRPFPGCSRDPTDDSLDCEASGCL